MGAVIVALVGALMVFLASEQIGNELTVVLPSADGHHGHVVVERRGGRTDLRGPYAASRIIDGGQPVAERIGAEDVRKEFARVLEALPHRPKSFLVYFLEGTDEFTAESRAELDNILAELRGRNAPDVVVIGHTDRVGNDQFNDKLSLQRAERVRGELVKLGIPGSRIQVAGRGERELLVPTPDDVAEARNRRVEINVR
jgi:outer membrane protein OmpA-like peptidoglycan-associated protein